ncbi:MAG TPA: FMN-binding protein [Bacillota bacterium]|nr:FMN-binding protein [Bacillota bacterium]
MNRNVVWLLVIAVVVVGLVVYFGSRVDDDVLDQKPEDIKEDVKDRTEDLGKDLEDVGERLFDDGKYVGRSDADDRGNYGYIELTIKDGKIKEVDYTEYQAPNEEDPKDEDYPYKLVFDAIDKLEEELVRVQDPDKVDDVAGATGTSEKFRAAAKNALEKAR